LGLRVLDLESGFFRFSLLLTISLFGLVLIVGFVWADPYAYDGPKDEDGWIICEDTILSSDLVFSGDGLTICGDHVTLDLNGFKVLGSGSGVGVRILSRKDVTVKGGSIKGFEFGIYVEDSSRVYIEDCRISDNDFGAFIWLSSSVEVRRSEIASNEIGVNIVSSSAIIRDNHISANGLHGIYLYDSGVSVQSNSIDNEEIGVFIWASTCILKENMLEGNRIGVDAVSSKVEMTKNSISDSLEFGVYLDESEGLLKKNVILNCKNYGIYLLYSDVTLKQNTIALNRVGIAIYSSSPVIIDNLIIFNWEFGVYCSHDSDPYTARNIIKLNGIDYYKEEQ